MPLWPDDEPDLHPLQHVQQGQHVPDDARRMGLDRNTEEGAFIAMVAALDSRRTSHRVVAWLIIVALTGPLLLTIWSLLV